MVWCVCEPLHSIQSFGLRNLLSLLATCCFATIIYATPSRRLPSRPLPPPVVIVWYGFVLCFLGGGGSSSSVQFLTWRCCPFLDWPRCILSIGPVACILSIGPVACVRSHVLDWRGRMDDLPYPLTNVCRICSHTFRETVGITYYAALLHPTT
jgi:hypothetical protein